MNTRIHYGCCSGYETAVQDGASLAVDGNRFIGEPVIFGCSVALIVRIGELARCREKQNRGRDPSTQRDIESSHGVKCRLLSMFTNIADLMEIDERRCSAHCVWMVINGSQRPDWDTYFMNIAGVVATRGNCSRRQVAALIVKDRRIISTGYNGTPRGVKNCFEGGCLRCASDAPSGSNLGDCVCCHAEENAITQAAYHGISVNNALLYCTLSPCLLCAKMIINAGIIEVIYGEEYGFSDQTGRLLSGGAVDCRQYEAR